MIIDKTSENFLKEIISSFEICNFDCVKLISRTVKVKVSDYLDSDNIVTSNQN